jgi:hypothetical protein
MNFCYLPLNLCQLTFYDNRHVLSDARVFEVNMQSYPFI